MQNSPPVKILPGRGALSNPSGRFETFETIPDPEYLDWEAQAGERPVLRTRFFKDNTKNILSSNDSPDIPFTFSVNPYRGCEHGCIYCYARPTHEYLGLSSGLDFESRIFVKTEAPQLLRKALTAKSWKPQPIVFSGVTDCYQPAEKHFKLTRQCLEVLAEFKNPVCLITKNYLITRDIDILAELARHQAVQVFISVTTLDEALARKMEPRTAQPTLRLSAIHQLSEAGIPVGVMMGPIIPGLTDPEIDAVLKAVSEAGARTAGYTLLRLPYGVKDHFQAWLQEHYPLRKEKVLKRVLDVRDGKLNDSRFGARMRGEGAYAEYISNLFRLSKTRYGLNGPMQPLSTAGFRRGDGQQLKLF